MWQALLSPTFVPLGTLRPIVSAPSSQLAFAARNARIIARRTGGASVATLAAAYRLSSAEVVAIIDAYWMTPPDPRARPVPHRTVDGRTLAAHTRPGIGRTTRPVVHRASVPEALAPVVAALPTAELPAAPLPPAGPPRRFRPAPTPEALARAAALGDAYRAGATVSALARQYQINPARVRQILDRAGVPRRGRATPVWFAAEDHAAAIVLRWDQGESLPVIARSLGVSLHRIAGILDRNDR